MSEQSLCAVFGNPIDHSLSPQIHQLFAQQTGISLVYEKKLVTVETFKEAVLEFFAKGGLGLNITLPLKELAYQMADKCMPAAETAKAANTLWMEQGQLIADNTDGRGLVADLKHFGSLTKQKVHLLGAGGAARGIIQPLLDAGVQSLSLNNRTMERAQMLQADFPALTILPWQNPLTDIDILINTTSANLMSQSIAWPNCDKSSLKLAYDLTYNPKQLTPFLQHYRPYAKTAVDGIGMLIEQAALSFERWHHVMPDTKGLRDALK